MGQLLIDDNSISNFIDDNGVQCFVDDAGNFTFCPSGTPTISILMGQAVFDLAAFGFPTFITFLTLLQHIGKT
jgi:hypothetical protein